MERMLLRTAWLRSGLANSNLAGRAWKTTHAQEDRTMPNFVSLPFSRSRRLETAYWLCLIICNRKTRNIYIFKHSVFSSIDRSAHLPTYNCIGHRLLP